MALQRLSFGRFLGVISPHDGTLRARTLVYCMGQQEKVGGLGVSGEWGGMGSVEIREVCTETWLLDSVYSNRVA